MQNSNTESADLHDNLIDMSSENDCLLDESSSGNPEEYNVQLSQSMDDKVAMDNVSLREQMELVPPSVEQSKGEGRGKSGKYNLRKSLAWDNAFFTNAGVLEPEELTCIMEGVEKDEKPLLPRIEEDIYKSTDSFSTIGDESLESLEAGLFEDIRASIQRSGKLSRTLSSTGTAGESLESLEAGLFEDIRASIQRSSKKSSTQSSTGAPAVTKTQAGKSPKVDTASGTKLKLKTASRKEIGSSRVTGKSTKQSSATSRESTSSLPKVPKTVGRDGSNSTASSKRASLDVNHIKIEKGSAKGVAIRSSKIAGAAPVSKMPPLGGLRSSLPRRIPSSKVSTNSSPAAKIERKSSSSSLDSLGSILSEKIGNPTTMRRKVVSGVGNPTSSATKAKTSSTATSKNKTHPGNSQLSAYLKSTTKLSPSVSPASSISEWSLDSQLSAYLKSTTKLSPSVSPASSISEWSLDSSSSSFTENNGSNSSRSSLHCLQASTDISNSQILDSQYVNDQCLAGNVSQESGSQGYHLRKTSTGIPPNPGAPAKPTGLKMPSTKFGFFDGVKSARTPKGSTHSQALVTGSLPKTGSVTTASPSRVMIKPNSVKPQQAQSVSLNGSKRPGSQIASPIMKPKTPLFGDAANSVKEVSNNVKSCPSTLKGQQKVSPKKELQSKDEEVDEHGIAKQNLDASSADDNNVLSGLTGEISRDVALAEKTFPSKTTDTNIKESQQDPKDVLDLLGNKDKKFHSGGEVNSLCRPVEHVGEDMEIQKEANGDSSILESQRKITPNSMKDLQLKDGEVDEHGIAKQNLDACSADNNNALSALTGEISRDGALAEKTFPSKITDANIKECQQDLKDVLDLLGNKDKKFHSGGKVNSLCRPVEHVEIQKEANGDSSILESQRKITPNSMKDLQLRDGEVDEHGIAKQDLDSCSADNSTGPNVLTGDVSLNIRDAGLVEKTIQSKTTDSNVTETQQDPNDVPGLLGNKDEKLPSAGEINGLCRFVEHVGVDMRTQKEANGYSSFLSQDDSKTKVSSCSFGLTCPLEAVVGSRIPFAAKDSFCNGNELSHNTRKTTEVIAEKLSTCTPDNICKENSSDVAAT